MNNNSICKVCGSEYIITEHKMIYRDKDTLGCELCGNQLMNWNGAVFYSAELQKLGSRKAKITTSTFLYTFDGNQMNNSTIPIGPCACEVISRSIKANRAASQFVPISAVKGFYKIKYSSEEVYIEDGYVEFI